MKELIKHADQVVFDGILHRVVQNEIDLPNGEQETWERVMRAPGTRTLIFDGEGRVLLTTERRHEQNGTVDYRLPGGKVCDSLAEFLDLKNQGTQAINEAALQGAKREVWEEAGIVFEQAELAHISKCGATIKWDMYYFIVAADQWKYSEKGQQLSGAETIELGWYTKDEILKLLDEGKILEDRTAGFLYRTLRNIF